MIQNAVFGDQKHSFDINQPMILKNNIKRKKHFLSLTTYHGRTLAHCTRKHKSIEILN